MESEAPAKKLDTCIGGSEKAAAMADVESVATNVGLRSLLSSPHRGFLVRNNGEQV